MGDELDVRREARERFRRAVEAPMLVLSLAFLIILLLPTVVSLSEGTADTLQRIEWLIWSAFAVELSANTYLAQRRLVHLRDHWFDVLIVLLPVLRPLRLVRAARFARLSRGSRVLAAAARFAYSVRALLAERGLQYVLLTGFVIVVTAAAAVTRFERGSDGSIQSFATALWWAATTVTTVGYGDAYPVTAEGRGVAVFLMILGIAMFGLLTASITSFFVRPAAPDVTTLDDVMREIRRLETRLEELSRQTSRPTD